MGSKAEREMDRTNYTDGVIDTDILIDASKGNEDSVNNPALKGEACSGRQPSLSVEQG